MAERPGGLSGKDHGAAWVLPPETGKDPRPQFFDGTAVGEFRLKRSRTTGEILAPQCLTDSAGSADLEWINARIVRLGTLLGQHAALVWFWDQASLNSLRALPYVKEWDRRQG